MRATRSRCSASPVRPRRRCWAMPLSGNDAARGRLGDPPARRRRIAARPPRCARRRRGRRRRRAGDDPRDLALARGRERHRHDRGGDGRPLRAADGQLRARRRRRLPEGVLPRARRSSRAASTAARPSAAPFSSIATRCRPRDRTSSSPAPSTSPRGRSPTQRRIPSNAAAARSSRCASPRWARDLRLGGADGPPLRQRPLPYPVPLDVTAPA